MTMPHRTIPFAGHGPSKSPPFAASLAAELIGTMILAFSVIGAAIFGAGFHDGQGGLNLGFVGVALALGLSVMAGAYAFGPLSGGHFNPAVTIGFCASGRFPWKQAPAYICAQIVGGVAGSSLIAAIVAGAPGDALQKAEAAGFAATGWGPLSPGGYPLHSAFIVEFCTTAVFVAVVLSITFHASTSAVAPVGIGLTLTLAALVAIPVSNGSFNPARSIASAVWGGPLAWEELWLSLVAPTLGATVAGLVFAVLFFRTPNVRPHREPVSASGGRI